MMNIMFGFFASAAVSGWAMRSASVRNRSGFIARHAGWRGHENEGRLQFFLGMLILDGRSLRAAHHHKVGGPSRLATRRPLLRTPAPAKVPRLRGRIATHKFPAIP